MTYPAPSVTARDMIPPEITTWDVLRINSGSPYRIGRVKAAGRNAAIAEAKHLHPGLDIDVRPATSYLDYMSGDDECQSSFNSYFAHPDTCDLFEMSDSWFIHGGTGYQLQNCIKRAIANGWLRIDSTLDGCVTLKTLREVPRPDLERYEMELPKRSC